MSRDYLTDAEMVTRSICDLGETLEAGGQRFVTAMEALAAAAQRATDALETLNRRHAEAM